jgi:hypothetical protein
MWTPLRQTVRPAGMAYQWLSAEREARWKGQVHGHASSSFHGDGCLPSYAIRRGMGSEGKETKMVDFGFRQEEKEARRGLEVMGRGCMAGQAHSGLVHGRRGSRVPCHPWRRER